MLVPLKVTLVVVPPAQDKDLDNLALDALPAVHEIFRPQYADISHFAGDAQDAIPAAGREPRRLFVAIILSAGPAERRPPSSRPLRRHAQRRARTRRRGQRNDRDNLRCGYPQPSTPVDGGGQTTGGNRTRPGWVANSSRNRDADMV